ncbi:MAG: iron-only hydrogenase system regulator [Spirochaetaceae bacterium]|nr:iron-only hydrogenase system regulator [Spirochaetaceae bacterium]
MKKIAVIGAVLSKPNENQNQFNETVAKSRAIVKGRMGVPFDEDNKAVVSITVTGELDEINSLTGKLGQIPGVTVKAAISEAQ